MPSSNGENPSGPLELSEVLYIQTKDGGELPFEVVGILEDPDENTSYAVLMHDAHEEGDGEFIVTDMEGNLVDDDALAQEILDEFLVFAEEAGADGGAS
ncbi:MAG: hypothetical protein JO029_13270 [Candidatus Eremiobacteraeota bacterium]|nr:hypothetical protein [Candidatus Eremiobacteraeota bacterium]MBV8331446.1 hypothetical protein [Candidatus Eremiobacteraeota bacterium]MBV8435243.1 hypothetical protein [Candidatus Eremiobacteraeota bacterium]MBV8721681.1 hypothetical protein [Candidatus Eremiobacteraeota bacterium]